VAKASFDAADNTFAAGTTIDQPLSVIFTRCRSISLPERQASVRVMQDKKHRQRMAQPVIEVTPLAVENEVVAVLPEIGHAGLDL
jgi:hypothetical protein